MDDVRRVTAAIWLVAVIFHQDLGTIDPRWQRRCRLRGECLTTKTCTTGSNMWLACRKRALNLESEVKVISKQALKVGRVQKARPRPPPGSQKPGLERCGAGCGSLSSG